MRRISNMIAMSTTEIRGNPNSPNPFETIFQRGFVKAGISDAFDVGLGNIVCAVVALTGLVPSPVLLSSASLVEALRAVVLRALDEFSCASSTCQETQISKTPNVIAISAIK